MGRKHLSYLINDDFASPMSERKSLQNSRNIFQYPTFNTSPRNNFSKKLSLQHTNLKILTNPSPESSQNYLPNITPNMKTIAKQVIRNNNSNSPPRAKRPNFDRNLLSYTPISTTIQDTLLKNSIDEVDDTFTTSLEVHNNLSRKTRNMSKTVNKNDPFWSAKDAERVVAIQKNRYSKKKPGLHKQTMALNKFSEMS